MKKFYLTLLHIVIAIAAFSHPPHKDFDYSIILSGPFKNDVVSISINKQLVINKFKVENVNASSKGYLNLTQNANSITVYYNGVELHKPKVSVSFLVDLEISVNGRYKKLQLDLRKGKVIIINNEAVKNASGQCGIFVEQVTEPFLFI